MKRILLRNTGFRPKLSKGDLPVINQVEVPFQTATCGQFAIPVSNRLIELKNIINTDYSIQIHQ